MSKKFRSSILDVTKDSVVMTPALFEHITEKNRLGYSEQEIIGAIQRYGQQFEALIASYHSDKGFHATRTINDLMSQWPQLLPRIAKDVLLALYDFRSNKTGGCFPGERAIAEKAGYSVRQVNRGKKELLRMGVIRWTRRYNGSNVYELDDASLACALVIGKILDQIKQEQDTLRREEMEGPAFGIDIMAMAIDNTADGIAMMAIPSGHEGSLTSNRTSKSTSNPNSLPNQINNIPHSANEGYSFDEDERGDLVTRLVTDRKWKDALQIITGHPLMDDTEVVLDDYMRTSFRFAEALTEVMIADNYSGLRTAMNAEVLLDAAIKNSQRRYALYQKRINSSSRAWSEEHDLDISEGATVKHYPSPSLCESLWRTLIDIKVVNPRYWRQNGRVWETDDEYEIRKVSEWISEERGDARATFFRDGRYIGEELG